MEESPFSQFIGDRHKGILTVGHEVMLQIRVLTSKGLQVKQGWLSVKTVKRKAILLDSVPNQKDPKFWHGLRKRSTFQTNDLDAFDSNYDDVPSAKAVLMDNLSSYDSDVLSELFEHGLYKELKDMKGVFNRMETKSILCQDVTNIVMHVNDHSDNVLPVNHNSLEHDNSALELLKHENDHLIKLLISQDLVHTVVNSLATINDYKSMQQSFMDEYKETLVLKVELAKMIDMIKKAVYNELSKRCS
ncbi:hypothetical protein Tco_0247692 [Tanacetum coccineum]